MMSHVEAGTVTEFFLSVAISHCEIVIPIPPPLEFLPRALTLKFVLACRPYVPCLEFGKYYYYYYLWLRYPPRFSRRMRFSIYRTLSDLSRYACPSARPERFTRPPGEACSHRPWELPPSRAGRLFGPSQRA